MVEDNNSESDSDGEHKFKGSYVERMVEKMDEDEEWWRESSVYGDHAEQQKEVAEGPEGPQGPAGEKEDGEEVFLTMDEDVRALLSGEIDKQEFKSRVAERDEREVETEQRLVSLDDDDE